MFYAVQLYVNGDKKTTSLRVVNYLLERGADIRSIGLKDPAIACTFFKEMRLKPVTLDLTSYHTNLKPEAGEKHFIGHWKFGSDVIALCEGYPIPDNASEQEVYRHLSDVWVRRFGDGNAEYSDPKVFGGQFSHFNT